MFLSTSGVPKTQQILPLIWRIAVQHIMNKGPTTDLCMEPSLPVDEDGPDLALLLAAMKGPKGRSHQSCLKKDSPMEIPKDASGDLRCADLWSSFVALL